MFDCQADLYFTGEMGHHDLLRATRSLNTPVILTEHSNCERGFLKDQLVNILQSRLGDDYVLHVSEVDRDPITIVSIGDLV